MLEGKCPILEKRVKTNLERYGVANVMQLKEIQDKNFKAQFRIKHFTLPSGKIISLMGYEPQVISYLLENVYAEQYFDFDNIPTFVYDENHLYFPDIYIPSQNLIIEVKSEWTYRLNHEININKKNAVKAAGFNFLFAIWCNKTKTIKVVQ